MDSELIPLVAERFKVLGDARRLALLSALQGGERMVSELAEATSRPQPGEPGPCGPGGLSARGKPGLLSDRRSLRAADLRRRVRQPAGAQAGPEAPAGSGGSGPKGPGGR
jgi:DNA-binding transcriptional ArsR family regulator